MNIFSITRDFVEYFGKYCYLKEVVEVVCNKPGISMAILSASRAEK